jgi:hypothetical protein
MGTGNYRLRRETPTVSSSSARGRQVFIGQGLLFKLTVGSGGLVRPRAYRTCALVRSRGAVFYPAGSLPSRRIWQAS